MRRTRIISTLLSIMMICGVAIPRVTAVETSESEVVFSETGFQEYLAAAERSVAPESVYGEYQLQWQNGGAFGRLVSVENDLITAHYEYDSFNQRTSKTVGGITTTYDYDESGLFEGKIVSENRNGTIFTYEYVIVDDRLLPKSFTKDGSTYYYNVDIDGTVLSLTSADGEVVCRYDYENNIVTHIWEKDENENWVDSINAPDSIGNANLIRYLGYYFDEETQWYYCGRMYDPVEDCFIVGDMSTNFASLATVLRSTPSKAFTEVLDLYDSCMGSSTFGKSMAYSSDGAWCSSLSEVEVLARMIYAENTYSGRNNDRKGEAWVVANRALSGNYPSNLKSICTQKSAFESISGREDRTDNARNPSTTSQAWSEAVSIACCTSVCFRYGSNSEEYLEDMMSRPTGITDQIYFVGLEYFRSVCRDGANGLTYSFGTAAGYVPITQVAVLDINTNLTTRAQVRAITSYASRNIFFNEA